MDGPTLHPPRPNPYTGTPLLVTNRHRYITRGSRRTPSRVHGASKYRWLHQLDELDGYFRSQTTSNPDSYTSWNSSKCFASSFYSYRVTRGTSVLCTYTSSIFRQFWGHDYFPNTTRERLVERHPETVVLGTFDSLPRRLSTCSSEHLS